MAVRISSFTSLTPSKPILYVLLIENVLGKLHADPVGAGTIPHCLQKMHFKVTASDSRLENGRGYLTTCGQWDDHNYYFTIILLLFHYNFIIIFPPFFARVRIPAIPKWSCFGGQSSFTRQPLAAPSRCGLGLCPRSTFA